MTDALLYVLLTLTAYRVWRLLARDDITEDVRRFVFGGDPDAGVTERLPYLYQLVSCAWCLGSWIALGTTAVVWAYRPLPLPGLWFAAVACGVGLLATVTDP